MPTQREEVQLDEGFQARLLEQMREEQAARRRAREIKMWVLAPLVLVSFVVAAALSLSADFEVAMVANMIASGLGYLLYRVVRARLPN